MLLRAGVVAAVAAALVGGRRQANPSIHSAEDSAPGPRGPNEERLEAVAIHPRMRCASSRYS